MELKKYEKLYSFKIELKKVMKSYEKLQKVMKLYENVMRNTCERLSAQIAINMFFLCGVRKIAILFMIRFYARPHAITDDA